MKKLLFLLLSAAVAVSASAGVRTSITPQIAKGNAKANVEARTATGKIVSTPAVMFKAPAKVDVPEGMAAVTLTAGDVWQDGSGYQMLLDADATAYGTIIPETGGLTTSGDASAETYAEFEYKIPENADGAMTTQNIIINNSVTIFIPAGVYDYCITNPTPGDRIWIASDQGDPARADNFEFAEGMTYVFTVTLEGQNDFVTMQILEPGVAGTVPENLTVDPASTSALVTWDDNDDMGWNLRWRPWTDLSNNPINVTLPAEGYESQIENWFIYDADQDGYNWGLAYTDDAQTDLCFYSYSWSSASGALTPDNWLISPEFDVTEATQLKFDVWGNSGSYPEQINVLIEVFGEDTTVYQLFEENIVTTTTQTTYTVELGQFAGKRADLIFRHNGTTDMYAMYLDNIFIGDPNAEIIEPAEWNYENGLTDTEFTINGLTPETKYEVQVQSAGNVSTSAWTDIVTFVTLAEGPVGMPGDVNKDGFVKIDDVTALLDALLGGNVMDETENYSPDNADVNGDGEVKIDDVTALIDMLLAM